MYSNNTILCQGKAYLPGEKGEAVKAEYSKMLDCGHARPALAKGAFSLPWGYVQIGDKRQEFCLACCAELEKHALKTVPVWSGYYSLANKAITLWSGEKVMTITGYRKYRHNFGGRFVAITARDEAGQLWHGRASFDGGDLITMHRSKGKAVK